MVSFSFYHLVISTVGNFIKLTGHHRLLIYRVSISSNGQFINCLFHQVSISSNRHFINYQFHRLDISSTNLSSNFEHVSYRNFIYWICNWLDSSTTGDFIKKPFHQQVASSTACFINCPFHQIGISSPDIFIDYIFHWLIISSNLNMSLIWHFINWIFH